MVCRIITELRHHGSSSLDGGQKRSIMDLLIILIDGVIDGVLESFFRFLANSVSYGRLLALALCHAALIEVFILLSLLFGKISTALAAIIFLGGTFIVIVLEALIAGIHTIRLHFYEWFTKFYEGGGVVFSPFGSHRAYTK